MFDAIINDPTIFEVTIVVILLVCVAIWQKLKQFSAILGGIYLLYLFTLLYVFTLFIYFILYIPYTASWEAL